MNNQQNIQNNKNNIRLPLYLGTTLAVGLWAGATFFGGKSQSTPQPTLWKEILGHIERSYVDSVDTDSLVDYGISQMLEKLDPHTAYIPLAEAELVRSQLESGFDGIGVEFNIFHDSVFVVTPLAGGPSAAVGIRTGDVILKANQENLTGPSLTSEKVFKALRGPKGTEVTMTIARKGYAKPLIFKVKRDKIPTFSVDAAYLLPDQKTGFLRINRFSETTFEEFKKHTQTLLQSGMKQLILDLRGNPGGYMDRATDMLDEMIGGEGILVYTQGRDPRNNYEVFAGKTGKLEKIPIIVLVDEGSASAAEIVSGTLQDYDRALVVGRRTFGKGLVQAPIPLSDGSELRLTISRYYIPSKRSIQKPFTSGQRESYAMERYQRSSDSTDQLPKKAYKTLGGRTVFGGGGITPDLQIPADTSHVTPALLQVYNANALQEVALEYTAKYRQEWEKKGLPAFLTQFQIGDKELSRLIQLSGNKVTRSDLRPSEDFIKTQLKALIARNIWSSRANDGLNNAYYQVISGRDKELQSAMKSWAKAQKMVTPN